MRLGTFGLMQMIELRIPYVLDTDASEIYSLRTSIAFVRPMRFDWSYNPGLSTRAPHVIVGYDAATWYVCDD